LKYISSIVHEAGWLCCLKGGKQVVVVSFFSFFVVVETVVAVSDNQKVCSAS